MNDGAPGWSAAPSVRAASTCMLLAGLITVGRPSPPNSRRAARTASSREPMPRSTIWIGQVADADCPRDRLHPAPCERHIQNLALTCTSSIACRRAAIGRAEGEGGEQKTRISALRRGCTETRQLQLWIRTRRSPSVPRVGHDERRLLPGRAAERQPLSGAYLTSFFSKFRPKPNRYLPASCSHKTLMLRRATEIRRRDRTKVPFLIRQECYCVLVPKYYCHGKEIYTIVAATRVFRSVQSLPLFPVVRYACKPCSL